MSLAQTVGGLARAENPIFKAFTRCYPDKLTKLSEDSSIGNVWHTYRLHIPRGGEAAVSMETDLSINSTRGLDFAEFKALTGGRRFLFAGEVGGGFRVHQEPAPVLGGSIGAAVGTTGYADHCGLALVHNFDEYDSPVEWTLITFIAGDDVLSQNAVSVWGSEGVEIEAHTSGSSMFMATEADFHGGTNNQIGDQISIDECSYLLQAQGELHGYWSGEGGDSMSYTGPVISRAGDNFFIDGQPGEYEFRLHDYHSRATLALADIRFP